MNKGKGNKVPKRVDLLGVKGVCGVAQKGDVSLWKNMEFSPFYLLLWLLLWR